MTTVYADQRAHDVAWMTAAERARVAPAVQVSTEDCTTLVTDPGGTHIGYVLHDRPGFDASGKCGTVYLGNFATLAEGVAAVAGALGWSVPAEISCTERCCR